MITLMDSKDKSKETEKYLDSQLWHACAGSMVQMLPVNSKVFYFPQGHAEHAGGNVDFRNCRRIPAHIPCRVSAVKFMADPDSDEVFAKIRLVPVRGNEVDFDDNEVVEINAADAQDKPASFAKTLTQSDANNGGGFSVPRYCAETIFPRLDYTADPPVQTILAKDVHGETWKFRHIYRGTPRRHLLTTGWSNFVNHKKLVAGDSIVFLRAENGDLCVGIRRAKRGIGVDPEVGWNPAGGNSVPPYGGLSAFLREDGKLTSDSNSVNLMGRGKIRPESVLEAVTLAANGQPFEIIYYPRASTPEFCVKASLVKAALQIRWCSDMRFKMPFETEDSSRISWFMGTVSSVQFADPIHWPGSPWRLLQVAWDEPDLLHNVKRVNPWLVELVSDTELAFHLPSFSLPRKKLRLPQNPDFSLDGQLPMPTFSNDLGAKGPFGCLSENTPAGMQGARHAQYGFPLSFFHLNALQPGLFPTVFPLLDQGNMSSSKQIIQKPRTNKDVSSLLSMGSSSQTSKKSDSGKPSQFKLFGQPILTEQQISLCYSGDTVSPVCAGNSSSEGNVDKMANISDGSGSDSALIQHGIPERLSCEQIQLYSDSLQDNDSIPESSHCKVSMESEDVGRTLDLSLFGSYVELYKKLANMFGIRSSETLNHVIYWDEKGSVKQLGDEPFGDFTKTARKLTIIMDSSSDNVGI